ncbi:MAG: MraY family glycosyltransferase [Candidatus Dependentiae bacterium]|nr:MraY family glycosyltransferase [Candidatus Dependentiae bacterium]
MDVGIFIRSGFALLISFLVTFYLVPLCCIIARRLEFIDEPDGKIKVHKTATPYMGGVAVYVGFLVAFCLIYPFENNMLLFFTGSTLLLFIGLIDDLIVLRPYQKFFGQLLAATCFLKAGLYLKAQFFSNYWNLPLSAFWMLLIINAFNLVDVMDGLATLLAICATSSFLALAIYFNQPSVIILLCAFLGPLLAFFWYNKPTAKIYLGDAGSLFIGGFLATVPFLFNWGIYTISGYLTPIVILAIPLLEVGTLILVRTYKKIPFYLGSPDHFSIYLQRNGWSKWAILGYVLLLSLVLFGVSFLFLINCLSLWILCLSAGLFLIVWFALLWQK